MNHQLIFSTNTKHLYVHVPFCNHICTYCDFKRILKNEHTQPLVDGYFNDLEKWTKKFKFKQFDTIFLGGGTPNCLTDAELEKLLSLISVYANDDCEFSIECNPDLINQNQIDLFKKYKVNRISLGVQSTNNQILKQINRIHTIEDVAIAVDLLHQNDIYNVSCDFIYALHHLTLDDVEDVFKFILKYQIPHVSFYALEIKSGSLMKKLGLILDEEQEADQMEYIIKRFSEINYLRYEVANWTIDPNYCCKHNMAYWLSNDWIGIGYGAHGFENKIQYYFDKPLQDPKLITNQLTDYEVNQQILMMGLRLVNGLDLNIDKFNNAYKMFKDKLKAVSITKNNHLVVDDINLLHNSILDLF
ncbi:radical SAM family heme chaperone HemW [Ureaplasma diversum]|uniref:Heme chaperone HemW n=1 Tax=Ureaplasma diversum NCTC 246 TaxID=1188241 RepID=A0A084F100_9BACT|nr:radical SAM family heme chaperone HemW [Ureaplasma diversum]KEZ23892.1 Hypothetical protein with a putative oxygen-independent coproporphyrinogen III oxidase [Ureaplasma diversum NCTC 246]